VIIVCSVINREVLNSRSTNGSVQAVYNVQAASTVGFLLVLPAVLWSGIPWHKSTELWSVLGATLGANSLIACPLAVPIIGAQGALLTNRCGGLCCSLFLDWTDSTISLLDYGRLLAFVAVIAASFVDVTDAAHHATHPKGTGGALKPSQLLLVAYVALGGMCITIQAKCNGRVTKDLGCWTYAIVINLGAFMLLALPLTLYCWVHLGVPPAYTANDWPRILFDGAYLVFYFGSMAILPRTIGYTAMSMMIMFGSMAASSAIDAYGITGSFVPFTETRGISLLVMMVGVFFFSGQSGQAVKSKSGEHPILTPLALEEAKGFAVFYGAVHSDGLERRA